jgi:hypothetical protein
MLPLARRPVPPAAADLRPTLTLTPTPTPGRQTASDSRSRTPWSSRPISPGVCPTIPVPPFPHSGNLNRPWGIDDHAHPSHARSSPRGHKRAAHGLCDGGPPPRGSTAPSLPKRVMRGEVAGIRPRAGRPDGQCRRKTGCRDGVIWRSPWLAMSEEYAPVASHWQSRSDPRIEICMHW